MKASPHFDNVAFDESDPTGRFQFEFHNVDVSIVNGLRRILLSDIPHVGFMGDGEECSVSVLRNTGALHNEFLQHRIGMIPIYFNQTEIDTFEDHEYDFFLRVKNTNHDMLNVTTHDFKGTKDDHPITTEDLHRLFPVHPVSKMPVLITRLRMNEEIDIECKPVVSTARNHASFCPVSLCCYHNKEDKEESKHVDGILNKERCFYRNEYNDPTIMVFELERECGLPVISLVNKAFDILLAKIQNGMQLITDDQMPTKPHANGTGIEFEFAREDDTLGNVIQSDIHNRYVRISTPSDEHHRPRKLYWQNRYEVSYVGYYCPHPLDTRMVVRIVLHDHEKNEVVNPENNTTIYKDFFIHAMRDLHASILELQKEWMEFAPKI